MSYLDAQGLTRSFVAQKRGLFRPARRFNAVDGVSLTIERGTTLGVVGESGCGKSTLSRIILGLMAPDSGEVMLDGQATSALSEPDWRAMRQKMQLVYQDASGSLDPRLSVRTQVEEPLQVHGLPLEAAEEALTAVGLAGSMADRYPHEMSGGQLQRVVIARALTLTPELLVLDEPVSALDVSIQSQIVNLLVRLQKDRGLTYLFVSHDLSIVRHISDRVAVMYLGQIVEEAPKEALFAQPLHPYTQALIDAVPLPDPNQRRARKLAIGDPPNPSAPPPGCRFHPRCPMATEQCKAEAPALRTRGARCIACHLAEGDA